MTVGALLVKNRRVLLGKRTATRAWAPNVWDVFGGHVEPGEDAIAALVRELREELGIRATILTPFQTIEDPPPADGALLLFRVDGWKGRPRNHALEEHSEIRWFSAAQASRVRLAHPAYPALIARACCP